MVGPQVVNLLPEHGNPEVFANELQQIQLVLKLWVISRQPLYESVASAVAEQLELGTFCGVSGSLQIV